MVVTGLRDLNKALKAASAEAETEMKAVLKGIAEGVVTDVRSRVPHRSGRAAASYRPRGGVKGASIAFGGPKAPYVPWLDFGGSVGKKRKAGVVGSGSIKRPVIKGGRFLYPAINDNMEDIQEKVAKAISDITGRYGFKAEGT